MSSHQVEGEPPASTAKPFSDDVLVAVKSAFALGASLLLSWSVALVVRFFLPRYLGPARFGALNFADNFCTTFFVFLGLGVDTYIQKEIPVRPAHASDFFGGFIVFRVALSALLFAAMAIVLVLTHRSREVQLVVFLFGVGQLLATLNSSLAALLHASRKVGELAVVNVASKLLWGAGIGISLALKLGLVGLAAAFLLAEAARMMALLPLSRRYLAIRMLWKPEVVKLVIVASFPFYLHQVANNIYSKIGISLLSILSNDTEVGWYSSASNLAGLCLLIAPLVGWVLFPLLARAGARSETELFAIMSRAVRTNLMLVLPVSLLLGLGADLWVRVLFGAAFLPAIATLRILAPMFVLTYGAMVVGTCLVLLGRAWTVTFITFAALPLNLLLNVVLIPHAMLGLGGAGAGAAMAVILTEFAVMAGLIAAIGARAFDRASVSSMARALACGLLVIGADALLRPLGPARLALDIAAYVVLLFALGAVHVEEVKPFARLLLQRHRHHAAP